MTASSSRHHSIIADTHLQRLIVCDPSARWLGAIRGSIDESQRRAVVPALDLDDAVGQSQTVNHALVTVFVPRDHAQKTIDQIRQSRLDRPVLFFAVCDPELAPWRLALVEAGCARVFTSLLQLDNLLQSAGEYFSVQPPVRFSWQDQILARMPWPRWASPKAPDSAA